MEGKAQPKAVICESSKEAVSTKTTMSFMDRYNAICQDETLTSRQKWDALAVVQEKNWIATHQPPLFTTAFSLDPPETKAKKMEAALQSGADPNELDHDLSKMEHRGRPLACCVNASYHLSVNGDYKGMANNLPAIEVLLRYGADPRLRGSALDALSALELVRVYRDDPPEPKQILGPFYKEASKIIEDAAAVFDGRYATG